MKRGLALGSAALVAALFLLVLTPSPRRASAPQPDVSVSPPVVGTELAGDVDTSDPAPAGPDVVATDLDTLRARYARSSLRGTAPDGDVGLDAQGRLRLDAGLVRRFEHYLSLIGEFEIREIRRLLQADLSDEFGAAVAGAALTAFDRYVGLRQALAETELSSDLARRLEQLHRLRRDWFGPDAEAMFGAEEAEVRYTLARRDIASDGTLEADERQRRLAELDAGRAPFEREAQRDATSALLADEQSRQFEHLGTDPETRREERAALWGEDAADRLAALDLERSDWDRRLLDYVRQRDRVLADPTLDAAARERSLAALRQRSFDLSEQARIEALEAIDALPRGG